MQFWSKTCLKLAWAIYLLLTSVYCLLAYLPYTYYAVIKAPPNEWMPWFVAHHVHIYWVLLLCAAAAYRRQLAQTRYSIFFGALATAGILLALHPVLPGLQNNLAAFVWSIASLLPVAVISLCEIISVWPQPPERSQASLHYFPIVMAALTVAVSTILGAKFRYFRSSGSLGVHLKDFELGMWSLLTHVMLAIVVVSLLNLIFAAAIRTPYPYLVRFLTLTLVGLFGICAGVENFLDTGFSFQGPLSLLYALFLALALVGLSCSLMLAWRSQSRLLLPETPGRARKLLWAAALAGLTVSALILPSLVVEWDWNAVVQQIFTLLLWFTLSAGFYQIFNRPRTYSIPAIFAVLLISGFTYKALQTTEFIWARPLGITDEDVADSIERYASHNISLQLAHHLLGNTPETAKCGELCRVLRQYSNVRNATTATEIKLVDPLVPATGERPNIFIFVIDSMRPDYLGVYNSKVDFTPNMDSLAKDGVTFRNAYTQYAGTTLSEPAIWSGAMLLHAHFLQPFENVNSLEKLVRADGYQMFVSFDSVLRQILSSSDELVKLDTDKPKWNRFEMCSTVQQLSNALDARPDKTRPVFFYGQPMNVHMFANNPLPTGLMTDWNRHGFNRRIALSVHQVDGCMGQFVSYLKTHGMYDNSVIILTSDHGDATGEFGRQTHSYIIYPEVMHVPLIVHLPGWMQGKFVADRDGISTLTDITPSLYYLLGHQLVRLNPMFGHPLFVKDQNDLDHYRRSEVFFASDVVAAYGLLEENGRYLYATYDSPARSLFFDLSSDPNAEHNILTDEEKRRHDKKIIDYLKMIADFYGYKPQVGSLLTAGK